MSKNERVQILKENIQIDLCLIAILLTIGLDVKFFEAILKQAEFDNLLPTIAGAIANFLLPKLISSISASRASIRRIQSTRE